MALKVLKPGSMNVVLDAMASMGGANLLMTLTSPDITAARYQTLQRNAVDYQVTAAVTLWIIGVTYYGPANGELAHIGYGDTAVTNSATPPTNNVMVHKGFASVAANVMYTLALWVPIPAQKYPYLLQGSTGIQEFSFTAFEE